MNAFDRATGARQWTLRPGRRDRRTRCARAATRRARWRTRVGSSPRRRQAGEASLSLDAARDVIAWQSQDFDERLLLADADRPRRLARGRWSSRFGDVAGLDPRHRRARMALRAPGGLRRERRDADLGRRPPAVRVVGVQRRQPGAAADATGGAVDGRGASGRTSAFAFISATPCGWGRACTRQTATSAPRRSRLSRSRQARSRGAIGSLVSQRR